LLNFLSVLLYGHRLSSLTALQREVESRGPVMDAGEAYGKVLGGEEVCGLNGMMVVDLPGVSHLSVLLT
jgi:hypothetical protein